MAKFDILKPELVCIGNRYYRKFRFDQELEPKKEEKKPFYDDQMTCIEEDMIGATIYHENNVFWCTMQQPETLFKPIQFQIKRNITQQLRAKITLTKSKEFIEITISAEKENLVYEAYRKISVVVEGIRLKMPSSHFISIPLNFPNIKKSFLEFKEKVLESCRNVEGIQENIFQDPCKLHLTVITLLLLGPQEKETAAVLLKECAEEISNVMQKKKLAVRVKGIEYMNDDPSEVDILYAKVEELDGSDCLQKIADLIKDKFINTSFAKDQYNRENVKLHITLMNSIYAAEKSQKRPTFDARKILEEYQNYDFGTTVLSEVHISTRHTVGKDGYYISSVVFNFA